VNIDIIIIDSVVVGGVVIVGDVRLSASNEFHPRHIAISTKATIFH
jgi:hypothetical protein